MVEPWEKWTLFALETPPTHWWRRSHITSTGRYVCSTIPNIFLAHINPPTSALAKVKNTPKPSKLPKEPTPKLGKTMPKPSETMSNLSTTTLKLGATTNLSPGNWILLYKG
ncbi:hypothetical protein PSTT_13148, partial [Puccinia striiformis]